jgi:hypothetical protein
MKFALAMLMACAMAVVAGCSASNPVKTPKGDYYALDARVTAVDAGVLHFVNDCKQSPVTSRFCTPANLKRLADATSALGTAMDGYSAAVRSPNAGADTLNRLAAYVDAALATVTALLAEFGVQQP